MLNENKIKMMTKMAIYEKNEGRQMIKNSRYFKGDYVAFGVLRTLIATTFAYIIMVILYVLCNLEKLVADINSLGLCGSGKKTGNILYPDVNCIYHHCGNGLCLSV